MGLGNGPAFASSVPIVPTRANRPCKRVHVFSRSFSRFHWRRKSGGTVVCMAETIPEWARHASEAHRAPGTPHAGSHFTRRDNAGRAGGRFFEGWFLRAVLPLDVPQAFAFMFSIEEAANGGRREVVGQVLGPDENLMVRRFSDEDKRWFASVDTLALGNWESASAAAGRPRPLTSSSFSQIVTSGFQLTSSNCSGRMYCEHSENQFTEWWIDMVPLVSWGTRGRRGRCTATWLSHLPIFEPGYQVLMGHGIASSGHITYKGRSWDLAGSLLYCEKNWGASFPRKWWWLQANQFVDIPDLTFTAVGARRMIAQVYEETIGMIAIHLEGEMYEFSNWNCSRFSWAVQQWGKWEAHARTRTGYTVTVLAETEDEGSLVLGPSNGGMIPNVRDAAYGRLVFTLKSPDGRTIINSAKCNSAQVEVGGGPWTSTWSASVEPLRQPLRGVINFGSERVITS